MTRGLLSSGVALVILITLLQKSVQGRTLHPTGSGVINGTLRPENWNSVEPPSEADGNQKCGVGVRSVSKLPDHTSATKAGQLPLKNAKGNQISAKINKALAGRDVEAQLPRMKRSSGNLDLSGFYGFGGESGGKVSKEQEKILRLMALLTSKEGGYAEGLRDYDQDDGDQDDDEEDPPLELGYYGKNPYLSSSSSEHEEADDEAPIHRHSAVRRSGNPALKATTGTSSRFQELLNEKLDKRRNIKPVYGNNLYSLAQLLGNIQEVDPMTPIYHRGIL